MDQFSNVTIVKKANVHVEGQVTSRSVQFADGSHKPLGIMLPGDYEFGTAAAEDMEMLAGSMDVLMPGETEWRTFSAGESFHVPANAKFKLKVPVVVDYCCSYAK